MTVWDCVFLCVVFVAGAWVLVTFIREGFKDINRRD